MDVNAFEHLSSQELDALATRIDGRQGLKFKFQLLQDLGTEAPAKSWLIKNVVALKETSAWIAPPGAMKSALLCELAFAVASKSDWHGHRAKLTGAVVYFALERADLVKRRLQAYQARAADDTDPPPVAVIPATVDLMNQSTVRDVVASIRAVEAETGQSVVLVIFDTFAKLIAAGGGDEDKARDQGRVFVNVQRIKDEIGCHVALVGHTGKDEARGSRGSNAILGDVDVMVTIAGTDIRTTTITKANDAAEGPLFSFASEVHTFGHDEDGDPITVNVVSREEVSAEPASKPRDRWPKGLKLVHEAIAAALLDHGADHRIGPDGPLVRAVDVKEGRRAHLSRYVSTGEGDRNEAERKAWGRNFKAARASNLIAGELKEGQELIWLVS